MITNLKQNLKEPNLRLIKDIIIPFCVHTRTINSETTLLLNFFLLKNCFQNKNKNKKKNLSYQYCLEDFVTTLHFYYRMDVTSDNYDGEVNYCDGVKESGKNCFIAVAFTLSQQPI